MQKPFKFGDKVRCGSSSLRIVVLAISNAKDLQNKITPFIFGRDNTGQSWYRPASDFKHGWPKE